MEQPGPRGKGKFDLLFSVLFLFFILFCLSFFFCFFFSIFIYFLIYGFSYFLFPFNIHLGDNKASRELEPRRLIPRKGKDRD